MLISVSISSFLLEQQMKSRLKKLVGRTKKVELKKVIRIRNNELQPQTELPPSMVSISMIFEVSEYKMFVYYKFPQINI